jgi:ligand-binding sensor domain-containing protein/anti-sigma regulatory factor (Ser/Thr protein kinase)
MSINQTINSLHQALKYILFTIILISCQASAQVYVPFFKNLKTEDGLSHNTVNKIMQDSRGFIWIATEDGLNRYDGRYFKVFRRTEDGKSGISGNIINDICEDKKGIMWIATADGGITSYDYRTESGAQFKQYKFKPDQKSGIPDNNILRIVDSGGYLWLTTAENRVVRFNRGTGKFDTNKISRQTVNRTSAVKNTLQVRKDQLIPYAKDRFNQVWLGSRNSGITIVGENGKKYNYRYHAFKEGTIASNHVNHIFISRAGIVWVGTDNGLSYYNPLFSSFRQYNLEKKDSDITINDFYRDELNRLWVATNQGLFVKCPGSAQFEHKQLSYRGIPLNITKIFVDVDKTFYLGTDYTLFVYDPSKNALNLLPNTEHDPVMKKLIGSTIVSIVRDTIGSHAVLIVSPYGHFLTYYDLNQKKWISRGNEKSAINGQLGVKDNLIEKFKKTSSGDVMLATNKFGLGEWDGNMKHKISYYGANEKIYGSLGTSHVFDILQVSPDGFWISTYGNGLNYFDDKSKTFSHVPESSNITEGLEKDHNGNLWMIANTHLHMFNPATKVYSCYDLPGLKHLGGLKGYIYRDNQGRLYAGGTNTFVEFNPGEIEKINHEPNVYLTDFQIFNTSYSECLNHKTIRLSHEQNYFYIEYAAPDFSGDNVVFAYKLEGLDKNWIQAGKRNFATYANLPGGRYVFKVRANNWKTDSVQHYASIEFEISPPFWLKWWFYMLILIALTTISLLVYCFRVGQIIKRHTVRNSIAKDLHDHVGSTLSSILIYIRVAKNHQQNERPAEVNDILGNIEEVSTEIISEMADIVWAIDPKNDYLSTIVDRIKGYGMPLCNALNINFSVIADARILNLSLEMKDRKNLYLVLKESLNNAIKYSECKNIKLSILIKNRSVHVKVVDDGIGFISEHAAQDAAHSLSGNGLINVKTRADDLGAKLEISSTPFKGTTIALIFPVPKRYKCY